MVVAATRRRARRVPDVAERCPWFRSLRSASAHPRRSNQTDEYINTRTAPRELYLSGEARQSCVITVAPELVEGPRRKSALRHTPSPARSGFFLGRPLVFLRSRDD